MSDDNDSLAHLAEMMREKSPECLNLLTAETDLEFEKAFVPFLERALAVLETNSKNFSTLGEVELTAILIAALSFPGFTVTQEGYSNGHVDLVAQIDHSSPALKKLGEAKIYNGPAYHISGMTQLLGRYTTGREASGFLLSYVRQKDIAGITKRLRQILDDRLPEHQLGPCEEYILKWSLRTKHKHRSGETVCLGHLGCNMHFE